jgi:hypothetical protein
MNLQKGKEMDRTGWKGGKYLYIPKFKKEWVEMVKGKTL